MPKAKRRSRSWRTADSSLPDMPGPHQSRRTTWTSCSSSKDETGTITSRMARSMRASSAVHARCRRSPPCACSAFSALEARIGGPTCTVTLAERNTCPRK